MLERQRRWWFVVEVNLAFIFIEALMILSVKVYSIVTLSYGIIAVIPATILTVLIYSRGWFQKTLAVFITANGLLTLLALIVVDLAYPAWRYGYYAVLSAYLVAGGIHLLFMACRNGHHRAGGLDS